MRLFDFLKNSISKVGIGLGFLAATAVGILGGIDAALMFPVVKLPLGLVIGGSSFFVNSVSYFYVVSQKDMSAPSQAVIHKNTLGSTVFGAGATLFIGITFVANFVGMYIGFTVLGGKLDLHWPDLALQIPGVVFGVSSAVSGLIFNVKVANSIWNRIREHKITGLPDIEKPLLINESEEQNRSVKNLSRLSLNNSLQNTEIITSTTMARPTYYPKSKQANDENRAPEYRKKNFSI